MKRLLLTAALLTTAATAQGERLFYEMNFSDAFGAGMLGVDFHVSKPGAAEAERILREALTLAASYRSHQNITATAFYRDKAMRQVPQLVYVADGKKIITFDEYLERQ